MCHCHQIGYRAGLQGDVIEKKQDQAQDKVKLLTKEWFSLFKINYGGNLYHEMSAVTTNDTKTFFVCPGFPLHSFVPCAVLTKHCFTPI